MTVRRVIPSKMLSVVGGVISLLSLIQNLQELARRLLKAAGNE